MKVREEATGQYESVRNRAIREALVKASEIKQIENCRLMICNQIKDRYINELFPRLYEASSQSAILDTIDEVASSIVKSRAKQRVASNPLEMTNIILTQ